MADIGTLSTMISSGNDSATLENALSVAEYFELSEKQTEKIISEVKFGVSSWKQSAKKMDYPNQK